MIFSLKYLPKLVHKKMFNSCVADMKDEYDMLEKRNECEDVLKLTWIEFTTRNPAAATLLKMWDAVVVVFSP